MWDFVAPLLSVCSRSEDLAHYVVSTIIICKYRISNFYQGCICMYVCVKNDLKL